MSQDKQWFVRYAASPWLPGGGRGGGTGLPDPVSTDELIKFTDRYNISRDEVMSQMGGSP